MALKEKILVVDDEEDILELVRFNLARAGYHVDCAMTGNSALEKAMKNRPDLIILDLMLPDLDGLEVCKILKGAPETSGIPVIMLTARGEEADIVVGLELGSDDYISKPFSPRVLLARVKAVLRRKAEKANPGDVIQIHNLLIDPGRRKVLVAGSEVELTYMEFEILHLLAEKPGWVFSREQIIDAVKGEDYAVTDRSVDVQIAGLRKKLGKAGEYIETVRGAGYRMKE